MALSPFADFSTSVHDEFIPGASDTIKESLIILRELEDRGNISSNHSMHDCKWNLVTSGITAEKWRGGAVDDGIPAVLTGASLTPGGYTSGFFISLWESMSLNTKEEWTDLMEVYEDYLKFGLRDAMETGISADDGAAGGIYGFDAFIVDTGTYAGLTMSNTGLSAYIFDYGDDADPGEEFSDSCLERFTQVCINVSHGEKGGIPTRPDAAYCSRADWATMKQKIETTRHIAQVYKARLELGFKNFVWDDVPVYWVDSMASTNKVHFINWDFIKLRHATSDLFVPYVHESFYHPGRHYRVFSKMQLFCNSTRHQGTISGTNEVGS